jgi:Ser/Thr protein kinase RdoA (MazF antagonist)
MTFLLDDIRRAAGDLCGADVTALTLAGGGGNSRVYRLDAGDAVYALKAYPPPETGRRDRLQTEYAALGFLSAQLPGHVPVPLAADHRRRVALYSWIDGERVTAHDATDIAALGTFLRSLHGLRLRTGLHRFAPASEAIFGNADVLGQIDRRIERLRALDETEPELAAFLRERFEPQLAARRTPSDAFATLAEGARTLSPSDFGFHNALRTAGGELVFIDFEYFGWDDPVKLVCDVVLHPAMALGPADRDAFMRTAAVTYGGDPAYPARLRAYLPLIALRWAGIVLNEFLPEVWERRVYAGQQAAWADVKARQLRKAAGLLDQLETFE